MTAQRGGRKSGVQRSRSSGGTGRVGTGSRTGVRRKNDSLSPAERRRLAQLVICGSVFVLLVAVKLLLPARMAWLNAHLAGVLEQNMDVQAVFAAVGEAAAGERDVGGALEDVCRAVFRPQALEEEDVVLTGGSLQLQAPEPADALHALRDGNGLPAPDAGPEQQTPLPAPDLTGGDGSPEAQAARLSCILSARKDLPENVSMEQSILDFDYCTPVSGVLSSPFGYRLHPTQGTERFHYGLDVAAETGTAVRCFADGTLTAAGESSSYGKYCIVTHEGGYSTLYAHCDRITAASGAAVKKGETIAEVGETGMATGPHLHFELQREGVCLNPIYYVTLP